jgi:hypothetical protein
LSGKSARLGCNERFYQVVCAVTGAAEENGFILFSDIYKIRRTSRGGLDVTPTRFMVITLVIYSSVTHISRVELVGQL